VRVEGIAGSNTVGRTQQPTGVGLLDP
jgi:hypothetical protein